MTGYELNYQEQRQKEKEARILSAREHAERYVRLVHAFSDEVWVEVEKELADENLT